jgi:hypothetical protein
LDSSSIELIDSEIKNLTFQDKILRICFSKAYIIKTMTGSIERTRWWQTGELIFTEAIINSELPIGSLICAGGDIVDNLYTYRDMIPIPFAGRGNIQCALRFVNHVQLLSCSAQTVRLQLDGVAKYIEHVRPPISVTT